MLHHCPFQNYIALFSPPPNFFLKQFKFGQTDILSNFCKFTNFFLFTGGSHILNSQTKQMIHHCPFQDSITLFTPPTQNFFISIQSWPGTRDIKFSSLYNFFSLHWGAPHIKFRQKINAPPLPFPKPYYTFFCAPPYFFSSPSNLASQIKNST